MTIRGEKQATAGAEESSEGLRGIAGRNFERSFQLADHVQVQGANLENGLLRLNLVPCSRGDEEARVIPITRPVASVVLEVGSANIVCLRVKHFGSAPRFWEGAFSWYEWVGNQQRLAAGAHLGTARR